MTISATDLALQAFETRPTRPEALADLARYFRERGMNELAAMFACRGLAIPPSDDLLFVESWARESLATDLSISGYYTQPPEMRKLAHRTCDMLSLDRSVSAETRDTARRNLHFYLQPIAELFPSWRDRRLTFSPPDDYRQMAPSVTRHGTRVLAAQRIINYWIDEGGYNTAAGRLSPGSPCHTRTLLIEIDPDTLIESVHGEITAPPLTPNPTASVLGFEDMRLFSWEGELWGISAVLDQNSNGHVEQWLARVGPDLKLVDARPIYVENPQPREKNWVPVVDGPRLRFIYSTDPTRVIDTEGKVLVEYTPSVAAEHLRGSSQAISFDGGWLAVVHWLQWFDNWPKYRHRFVWYDHKLRLKSISPGWVFSTKHVEPGLLAGYEYCTGLCWHPDEKQLLVGYQIHERESWIGRFEAANVRAVLAEIKDSTAAVEHKRIETSASIPATKQTQQRPWADLSVNRSISSEEREAARRRSVLNLRQIGELLPSWWARRLAFAPPDGFAAHASSLINRKGRLLALVRCINYACHNEGGYYRIADGAPIDKPNSRTFVVEFDPATLEDSTLRELSTTRVLSKPRDDAHAYGFEDMKPFEWGTKLWAIGTFVEQSADGLSEQWLARIDEDSWSVDFIRRIDSQAGPRRGEKNWMPIVDVDSGTARFIYLCDPTTIIDHRGQVIHRSESEFAAEHLHGGSQAIPFEGGWLAVVHWRQENEANRWVDLQYRNRFVWLDKDFNLKRVSPVWEFLIDSAIPSFPRRFQIAHGLAWHSDDRRLIMSYEMYEREPWVGMVDADDIRKFMGFGEVMEESSLDENESAWVLAQTNKALLSESEVEHAVTALNRAGMPRHVGPVRKDWDSYLAIRHCVATTGQQELVLDAGGVRGSSFLPALRALGYSKLINLVNDETCPGFENGITYQLGDITSTDLLDDSVGFVLCQSVLEHDVDWRAFFKEMSRIMSPGANLFVSVDYWNPAITSNVTIFSPNDIMGMMDYAKGFGLECQGELDYKCQDSWPWAGNNYTFFNFLLKKKNGAS